MNILYLLLIFVGFLLILLCCWVGILLFYLKIRDKHHASKARAVGRLR